MQDGTTVRDPVSQRKKNTSVIKIQDEPPTTYNRLKEY